MNGTTEKGTKVVMAISGYWFSHSVIIIKDDEKILKENDSITSLLRWLSKTKLRAYNETALSSENSMWSRWRQCWFAMELSSRKK